MKPKLFSSLSERKFTHHFVDRLPADPETENFNRQVTESFYSLVKPTPTRRARLVGWSDDLAAKFGLRRPDPEDEDVQILSGNSVKPEMQPWAAVYGGHQFGNWAGQLGDGRAITLGEITDLDGKSWELQLKGAGPTPYSRRADGRAVLRSAIREFICSEAMHHLGVPTTRALSIVTTGDSVIRDMFYDGHPEREPGAITARMAPSFIRFGNFELFAARKDLKNLKLLADDVIKIHFPELLDLGADVYLGFFREVCTRSVHMGVEWMRIGFVHGVMNTDNMSILGLTIDYGPYGWLDNYDPSWTPNTTDMPGRRYCYGRQPNILIWNLLQFANALVELSPDSIPRFEEIFHETENLYEQKFLQMMADKLGLKHLNPATDIARLTELDRLLLETEVDMTLFYRGLSELDLDRTLTELPAFLLNAFYVPDQILPELKSQWLLFFADYQARVKSENGPRLERSAKMNFTNPLYVPRNYLAQACIDAAAGGDLTLLQDFMDVLKRPYDRQEGADRFAEKRPEWAKTKAGCSTLSCSS